MATAKEIVRELLDNLPDDCTLDEVQYHPWVRQRIEEARQEIRDGQFFTQEEIEKDLCPVARRVVWAPRARYDLQLAREFIAAIESCTRFSTIESLYCA